MSEIYLRVLAHPTRLGQIIVETVDGNMFPRASSPTAFYRALTGEMASWSLDRLRDWYMMAREFGEL